MYIHIRLKCSFLMWILTCNPSYTQSQWALVNVQYFCRWSELREQLETFYVNNHHHYDCMNFKLTKQYTTYGLPCLFLALALNFAGSYRVHQVFHAAESCGFLGFHFLTFLFLQSLHLLLSFLQPAFTQLVSGRTFCFANQLTFLLCLQSKTSLKNVASTH